MNMEKEKLVYLVTAAKQGDGNAINELFNAFYEDLRYFALKTVKDEDLSYEITQEAFIEIINTLGNLKEPAAFVTWAKQITYHQCTRYFKKKKDVIVDEDEDGGTIFDIIREENTEFIPDEALDKNDFKATVLAILDDLSEEQRSATMMYYFDEMSVREIAEVQGVSEGTVKSRLNYARKAIKQSVEEYEKKNNIKLHAIPFFPLIRWALSPENPLVAESAAAVAEAVSTATGVTVSIGTAGVSTGATVAAGTTAAGATVTAGVTATGTTATAATGATAAVTVATTATATTATATSVGIGAKIMALPLVTKIVAGITAVAIAAGGTTAAVLISQNNGTDSPSQSTNGDVSASDDNEKTVLSGTIPQGCTYTLHDGTVLKAGDKFPDTCTRNDKVEYGDYYYGYECIYVKGVEGDESAAADNYWRLLDEGFDTGDSGVALEDILGCWTPAVKDRTKTSYGEVLHSINGKEIRNLFLTFANCNKLTSAPEIPPTVTSVSMAFFNCYSLKTAPVIPKSVKRMTGAFENTRISGDLVYNGELDKSTFWYYYSVLGKTDSFINLTGEASESDLMLIAANSVGQNITINGKPFIRYFDVSKIGLPMTSVSQYFENARQFYREEEPAGYSGDYESGETCSVIYSAHAISDHFNYFDWFGYNLGETEFMILNTAYGWAHYEFTKDNPMTSGFNVQIDATIKFKTRLEMDTMLQHNYTFFVAAMGADGNFNTVYNGQYLKGFSSIDQIKTYAATDNGVELCASGINAMPDSYVRLKLKTAEVDGHYEMQISYGLNLPSEYVLAE